MSPDSEIDISQGLIYVGYRHQAKIDIICVVSYIQKSFCGYPVNVRRLSESLYKYILSLKLIKLIQILSVSDEYFFTIEFK